MIYVSLPPSPPRRLNFYLAMEEWLAQRLDHFDSDLFCTWQVGPSVICGRNQLIASEVNLDYCRNNGIEVFRRKSGGGCVYADMGNVMYAVITRCTDVHSTFRRAVTQVADALCQVGINAEVGGRNDILVDGRKVSGGAFYSMHGRAVIHGTMLYDTHLPHMQNAISPSASKLQSKGVKSVRSRIGLLKESTSLTLPELVEALRDKLCSSEITLSHTEVSEIEDLGKEYLLPWFINGHTKVYSLSCQGRIEGVGGIEVRLDMKNNIVRQASITGDFFVAVPDAVERLEALLRGVPLTVEALNAVLPQQMENLIIGLSREALVQLIVQTAQQSILDV